MKDKTSLRALIGLVAVVAVIIGILVWPTPKEAKAWTWYNVYVYNAGTSTGVEGLQVTIWMNAGANHCDGDIAEDYGDGWYTFEWDNPPPQADSWEVEIAPADLEDLELAPNDPLSNPTPHINLATTYMEWKLAQYVER